MEEDIEAEWEANQRHDPGGNTGGKVDWVLDKGFTLGKKILVTGFVMTSAPIVLPPLVVISAIGFLCSVPYSIFLASYACTEKLLSKLLPCPSTTTPSSLLLGYDDDECGVTYWERGFDEGETRLGGADFSMEDIYEEERKGEMPSKESDMIIGRSQEGERKKLGMEETRGRVDDVLGVVITIEGDEKLKGNVKEEVVPFEVTGVAVDLYQGRVDNEEENMAREIIGLIEKMIDEVIVDNSVVEDKQIGTEGGHQEISRNSNEMGKMVGDRNADDRVDTETLVLAIGIENADNRAEKKDGKDDKMRKEKTKGGKESQFKKEKENSPSATEIAEGVTEKSGSDSSEGRVISDYAVHKVAVPLKIAVSPAAKEIKHSQSSSPEAISSPSNQVMYGEEQLWKQIDTVRKIVGYNAVRHGTFIEEIKALYVFTGVESPSSFKDPSDLVEINNKLRFLKSIVGVK